MPVRAASVMMPEALGRMPYGREYGRAESVAEAVSLVLERLRLGLACLWSS